jgi:hypothetical protein
MNKNFSNLNNLNKPAIKEDDCSLPSKSVAKSDNKPMNLESVVKNGETRTFLNNLAKKMLEDLKDFSTQSVELFNTMNEKITHEYHMFLKHACKENIYVHIKL